MSANGWEEDRLRRIEAKIAQLEAELAQLKRQVLPSTARYGLRDEKVSKVEVSK